MLDGQAGKDPLNGGTGDDTYGPGAETAGIDKLTHMSGFDTINTTIPRSLANFIPAENLPLLHRT